MLSSGTSSVGTIHDIRLLVETIQKAVILKTARMVRKILVMEACLVRLGCET